MSDLPTARLERAAFADLRGWGDDDHAAAFAAFRRSALRLVDHPPTAKPLGADPAALASAARAALALGEAPGPAAARAFFERHFTPVRVVPDDGGEGFVTGFFEPEVAGARTRSARFAVPLHGLPADLAEIAPGSVPGLDPALAWARRLPGGGFAEHPDRAAIAAGALDGRAPVLAWLESPVDAFFIHVQGSARIRTADGVMRVTFAGKTGHPYFSIARVMVERGIAAPRAATADALRAWLEGLPPAEAAAVMARNRSYIFFREAPVADPALGPVAAAGVPLSPGRSLAVDRRLVTFHTPLFVETVLDDGPFARLMVAQDTGSAILGPARGDIYFGTGEAAWLKAARVRHPAAVHLLLPVAGS